MIERQATKFIAPPLSTRNAALFLNRLPEPAQQRKRHITFSTAYPRLPQRVDRAAGAASDIWPTKKSAELKPDAREMSWAKGEINQAPSDRVRHSGTVVSGPYQRA